MRSAFILLVAGLALGACASTAPPPAVAMPPPVSPAAADRSAECARGAALVAQGNAILASRGRSDLVDVRTPCDPPPADSGMSYAKPAPPRVTVNCRSYRFRSSGNSTVTCTSEAR